MSKIMGWLALKVKPSLTLFYRAHYEASDAQTQAEKAEFETEFAFFSLPACTRRGYLIK
jgi:hypothetical protein